MIGPAVGTAILFVAYLAWGLAIYAGAVTPLFDNLFVFVPALAGFVSSWMAPRNQLAPTVFLAIPAALFAAALNAALQVAGKDVGFSAGPTGPLRAAFFTLFLAGLFCAVGGLLAVVVRRATGRV